MNKTLITEWLNQPRPLSAEEQQEVGNLLSQYPYLLPAQWMEMMPRIQNGQFTQAQRLESALSGGDWFMLQQLIGRYNGGDEKVKTVAQNGNNHNKSAEMSEANGLHDLVFTPPQADDYFMQQGIEVSDELPSNILEHDDEEEGKSLMVMMSFEDWLLFLKKKNEAKRSEEEDKAMLRAMWQREKLAAALEEEEEQIPESVFEMAINSIDKEEIMVSESLAEIHVQQGKFDKAIEVYRKLSLQNPEKKTYFAAKIEQLNKEKLS